jgi:gamma-glutamylcyclotransferase (GGCT)/AIG2-like uncharacterized protein YtfP
MSGSESELIIFAYGSLRRGERDHGALQQASYLGMARSAPNYRLVDLNVYPAMIEFRGHRVLGELYQVTREIRRRLDVLKEVPVLFQRQTILLEDGRAVEAYLMRENQVPGRRRLRMEDWKQRFRPIRERFR